MIEEQQRACLLRLSHHTESHAKPVAVQARIAVLLGAMRQMCETIRVSHGERMRYQYLSEIFH